MSFKNQVFKRTNVEVDGDLKVSGELNKGRFAQIDAISAAVNAIETTGFLGDLYVRGQVFEALSSQWVGPIANPFGATNIQCVSFGNAVYIVGAFGTKISRSTDFGVTWSGLIANSFANGILAMAFGNNVFVGVGETGSTCRSTDLGVTWSALIANPFGANNVLSVAFGTNVFIAGGSAGVLARSTDFGATWSAAITIPIGVGDGVASVAFGNGVFVGTGSSGQIMRSTDLGVTWGALITNPFGGSFIHSVAFGNGIFVAVSAGGKIARSLDLGVTWGALITNPFGASTLFSVAFNFGIFQASGAGGITARSYDNGLTWGSLISNPFGANNILGIASSPTNMVAIGNAGSIATAGWNAVFSSAPEQLYTPTFTNFGTVTAINFSWRRVGNRVVVMGKFTAGVVVAGEARISLPFGITSDAALIPSLMGCGSLYRGNLGAAAYYCLIESGAAYITFGLQSGAVGALGKQNGNAILNNAEVAAVSFEIPISGWNQ